MRLRTLPGMIRFVIVFALFSSLPVLMGALLKGWEGALMGIVFADITLMLAAMRSEKSLTSRLGARPVDPSEGIARSLQRAIDEMNPDLTRGAKFPQLYLFSEPRFMVLVARAMGSEGAIFLSQGALCMLSERELRAVLKAAVLRSWNNELVFNSFCAVLFSWIQRIVPFSLRQLLAGRDVDHLHVVDSTVSPWQAVCAIPVFSLSSILQQLCSQIPISTGSVEEDQLLLTAWSHLGEKPRNAGFPGGPLSPVLLLPGATFL